MARIRVFKGREARLNKAIFWILAYESPLSIYEIWRKVRGFRDFAYIRYHVVNRRIRDLEKSGYLERDGKRKTKTGFTINLYQLSLKAYLAIILNTVDLNEFIKTASQWEVVTILAILAPNVLLQRDLLETI